MMGIRFSVIMTVAPWLLAAFLLMGCRDGGPSSRGGVILGQFSQATGRNDVPGLDEFSVVGGSRDGQLVYAAWLDRSSAGSATTGPNTYEAHSIRLDGRRYAITCTIDPLKGGVVTIDGRDYNLSSGAMFLVSTQAGAVRVKQMQLDLKTLPTNGGQALRDFAKGNAEIRDFYTPKETGQRP